MDSGWIVAATSIATIVATGFFNLRVKRIEAEQKTKEHKLSIRSTFVTEKIKAGQAFIGKNNVMIHRMYYEVTILEYLIESREPTQSIIEKTLNSRATVTGFTLEANDYTDLFFDISYLNKKHSILSTKADAITRDFNTVINNPAAQGYSQTLEELILAFKNIASSLEEMNKYVREDLAKYDIL